MSIFQWVLFIFVKYTSPLKQLFCAWCSKVAQAQRYVIFSWMPLAPCTNPSAKILSRYEALFLTFWKEVHFFRTNVFAGVENGQKLWRQTICSWHISGNSLTKAIFNRFNEANTSFFIAFWDCLGSYFGIRTQAPCCIIDNDLLGFLSLGCNSSSLCQVCDCESTRKVWC